MAFRITKCISALCVGVCQASKGRSCGGGAVAAEVARACFGAGLCIHHRSLPKRDVCDLFCAQSGAAAALFPTRAFWPPGRQSLVQLQVYCLEYYALCCLDRLFMYAVQVCSCMWTCAHAPVELQPRHPCLESAVRQSEEIQKRFFFLAVSAVNEPLEGSMLAGTLCHGRFNACPDFAYVTQYRIACVGDLWTPLLFLLFNGGDLVGRLLAGIGDQQHRAPAAGTLVTYAVSRVVLVIGLLLCHVVTPHPWRLPELFRSASFQDRANFPMRCNLGAFPRLESCFGRNIGIVLPGCAR